MDSFEDLSIKVCNSLLPELDLYDDQSPYDFKPAADYLDETFSTLKEVINFFQKHSSCYEELVNRNQKQIIELLVFCGEHTLQTTWNSESIVTCASELVDAVCSFLKVKSISNLLAINNLGKHVLLALQPKLKKNLFRRYPAALQCFIWITTNLKNAHAGENASIIIPVALNLLDDHQPEFQMRGLDCIDHMLKEMSSAELEHLGWAAVIYDAIKPGRFLEKQVIIQTYSCIERCLKILSKNSYDPTTWFQSNPFEITMNELLQNMAIETNTSVQDDYLTVLSSFVCSMEIRITPFISDILRCLEEYIPVGNGDHHRITKILKVTGKSLVALAMFAMLFHQFVLDFIENFTSNWGRKYDKFRKSDCAIQVYKSIKANFT